MGLSHWVLWCFSEISSDSHGRCTTAVQQQHLKWKIRYLTFTGIVFRFEVGLLLIILLGFELLAQRFDAWNCLKLIVKEMMISALFSLALTVPIDSFFWQKWPYWPEGVVFYFNAIQNKSSEWGTLPFYAYFLSFLPRLLLVAYPLAIWGFIADKRLRRLLMPMITYVAVFSLLPHKEWRFIFYTIPVFTAAAANMIHNVLIHCQGKEKVASIYYRLLLFIIIGGVVASGLVAQFMFQISRLNYPGGEALRKLHQLEELRGRGHVSIYFDADTAMTGASLYGQANPYWQYSKNESHQTQQDYLDARYTHFITAHPEQFETKSSFEIIDVTYGLDKVALKSFEDWKQSAMEKWNVWPIEYEMTPKLFTLRLKEPQKNWILSTVQKYPIVLYSKSYCPFCLATKQLLSKYCDLKEQVHIIEVDYQADQHQIKMALGDLTGRFTFPNLFMNGQSLGGFDNLSVMDKEGKLKDFCA
ncbi:Alg9-like mannosyltransferase family-domain-containing protein [Mycotypha africana]|uniref:Alg9-like mannosyltransferase family-domain-containing protein n=1 Tax=Mycotypha africana TaxID=64632 RepID=UPI002301919B|nr:Alg9-like mannosyltransferase family-domain-containing protein [Mycotypha africana]KAI8975103.1 Alg9-like mannosyltransferase family-domain-containing protein [Mycotypha africana]